MSSELWRLGACEVTKGIRAGEFSCREVVDDCLQRFTDVNGAINALTEVRADDAQAAADRADQAVAKGQKVGSLHGVPVTIKGNVDLAGWITVNGSKALLDNMAEDSSPSVQNLINAGAIVIGRTNNPEYCVRWETDNEVYGRTKNPWNSEITPGGSSGGAAASLAAGITPLGHGNDLGGSLRQPAQACGIASLRSTLGRIPNFVPTSPDQSIAIQLMNTDGPMARSIADVRLGFQAMAVGDVRDPWWVPVPLTDPEPTSLPVAVIVDPLGEGVADQVASGVNSATAALEKAGYATQQAEPQTLVDAVNVWKYGLVSEIFMGLEPAVKDICGEQLRTAFDFYRQAVPDWTPEKYSLAFIERRRVLRDWLAFFQRHSVIVAPVSTLPPQVANFDVSSPENMASLLHSMRMVVAINALGLPSAIVPVGVKDGLPQAVQVIGAPFQELRCLEVAEAIEAQVGTFTPIDPR